MSYMTAPEHRACKKARRDQRLDRGTFAVPSLATGTDVRAGDAVRAVRAAVSGFDATSVARKYNKYKRNCGDRSVMPSVANKQKH
jgi:hypothetical protein